MRERSRCRGRFRQARLTCARQSVVTARPPVDPRDVGGCSTGRSGLAQGARQRASGPRARSRPPPAARRPPRQRPERPSSGADPPARPAAASAGRSTWLSMPSRWPAAPTAVRPSATFGGHQRPRIGLNPPRHPPAGWLTAPHSAPPAARSALRAGFPWPDTPSWPAQRSSSGRSLGFDTPSAPRAPRAGGRWRGVNALCAGDPALPRDPRPPTPPPQPRTPCQFPAGHAPWAELSASPCGTPSKNRGLLLVPRCIGVTARQGEPVVKLGPEARGVVMV